MERNWITQGIVLRTYKIGENHLGCLIATPDRGNLQIILHGAGSSKGKLRRGTEILSEHTYYLYEDPQKNSIKVTDLDNSYVLDALRNSLEGYACATLGAEIMIHLHTDNSPEFFQLFSVFLRTLEFHSSMETKESNRPVTEPLGLLDQSLHPGVPYKKILNTLTITSVFLWKFMDSIGILPDLFTCVDTEQSLIDQHTQWYSYGKTGFVSSRDQQIDQYSNHTSEEPSNNLMPLPFPGLRVIRWIIQQPLDRAIKEPLPDSALVSITLLGGGIIEHFLGRRLKSLAMLRGLI